MKSQLIGQEMMEALSRTGWWAMVTAGSGFGGDICKGQSTGC